MAPVQQQVVHVTGSGQNFHEVLKIATAPVVEPQEGEVLVRIIMRPINPVRTVLHTWTNVRIWSGCNFAVTMPSVVHPHGLYAAKHPHLGQKISLEDSCVG
jgi:hypothetical protein